MPRHARRGIGSGIPGVTLPADDDVQASDTGGHADHPPSPPAALPGYRSDAQACSPRADPCCMTRREHPGSASGRHGSTTVRSVGRTCTRTLAAGALLAWSVGPLAGTEGQVGRSLPFLVTSVTLQQQELENLLGEYVRWGGETSHLQVLDALDRFGAGATELAGRTDRTALLFEEYLDLMGSDASGADTSLEVAFERTERLLRRWKNRSGTILARIAPDIERLQEGDAIVQHGIRRQLDSLGSDLLALQLAAFERQDQMDAALERSESRLARQVRSAYIVLGIGIVVALSMLGYFFRLKARAASTLAASNERLLSKIEEARQLARQLAFNATHDQLTGLHDRHGFVTELEAIFADVGAAHGIVFIDLDKFKVVNDTCGHAAGDALLQRIGELLSEQARGRGSAARFGGDEFVLLLPRCNLGTLRGVAISICRLLADMDFRHDGQRFAVGGKIGRAHV